MKIEFHIPSPNGHDVEVFHKLDKAEKRLAELTGEKKMRAAVPTGDGSHKLLNSGDMDENTKEIVFFGPLVGG